jgi:hypothetical protein
MITRTTLLAGVASLAIVGGIVFAMSSAGAEPYYNDEPTYHHTVHHTIHRARYERARYESERASMNDEQMPSAFQVRLSSIDRPNDQLKHASVRDSAGNTVGYVDGLVTGPDGDIRAVKLKVGGLWGYGGKQVVVAASDFRYERDRNELTSDLPKKEFDHMPALKS